MFEDKHSRVAVDLGICVRITLGIQLLQRTSQRLSTVNFVNFPAYAIYRPEELRRVTFSIYTRTKDGSGRAGEDEEEPASLPTEIQFVPQLTLLLLYDEPPSYLRRTSLCYCRVTSCTLADSDKDEMYYDN